ncbi:MAG: hypothetical protein IJX93_06980 [Clostridia bacterium]|nr:hypothetical protein [Clostridia bacterium]MBQ8369714.1 hypothetical protein [Clostridia bacterium]
MKLLLILVLAALLAGCVSTTPAENIPDKPEETAEDTLPDETETENQPAMPDPIPADTPYTGDIFYFTKLPAEESNIPEPEDETVVIPPGPTDTYRALGALAFDFANLPSNWHENNYTNTLISYTDEQPRIDSIEYLRMETDGIVYPADETKFTSPMGYTADGKPFFWETANSQHSETAENRTEYLTYIRLNDASMVRLTFYSYAYDEDFVNSFLIPKLCSCRTWTPEVPLKLRFTTDSTLQSTPSADYHIDIALHDSWQWNNSSVADDIERMYTGRYAIKRMEFYPVTYTEPFQGYEQLKSQGIPEPITGTTDEGIPYEIYIYNSYSEGESLGCTWYFANLAYDGRYINISFLTYGDDPDNYFDTVTLPVIKSVHIEAAE